MERYTSERCGDCGRGLTWIEVAFGRVFDPVCGACLMERNRKAAAQCPKCGSTSNLETDQDVARYSCERCEITW